jgi:hypothetical protein
LIKTLILDQALDNVNLQGNDASISDSDIIKCSILKGFLLHQDLCSFELPICLTVITSNKYLIFLNEILRVFSQLLIGTLRSQGQNSKEAVEEAKESSAQPAGAVVQSVCLLDKSMQ